MSTSRRVKATYVRDGLLTETTVSALYDIRQNRIAEEGRIPEHVSLFGTSTALAYNCPRARNPASEILHWLPYVFST